MAVAVKTLEEFEKEVLNEKDKVVLVDFWAVWCMPCQILSPIVHALEQELPEDKFKVVKVNVDEAPELAAKYGIMSIPTVMLFKNGENKKTLIGVQSKEVYNNVVMELLEEGGEDSAA